MSFVEVMKILLLSLAVTVGSLTVSAQDYVWETTPMDGSRTGCSSPSKDNVKESLGYLKGRKYISPDGKTFGRRTAVARTARTVLEAQPKMARVKDVVGYSTESMSSYYPESPLSNWFIDILMAKTQEISGRKVHMGITNFGGIRMDMPQGDVILDDLLSMFPFKNYLTYVEQKGSHIRKMLEGMAARRFQVLGGVKVVSEGGKLISVEIDGEPLDDDKIYGIATISFLLGGGDGLSLDKDALTVEVFDDVAIIDAVLEHVYAETAAGRPIESQTDGRVVVKDYKKKRE